MLKKKHKFSKLILVFLIPMFITIGIYFYIENVHLRWHESAHVEINSLMGYASEVTYLAYNSGVVNVVNDSVSWCDSCQWARLHSLNEVYGYNQTATRFILYLIFYLLLVMVSFQVVRE